MNSDEGGKAFVRGASLPAGATASSTVPGPEA